MELKKILSGIKYGLVSGTDDIDIKDISQNSNNIKKLQKVKFYYFILIRFLLLFYIIILHFLKTIENGENIG